MVISPFIEEASLPQFIPIIAPSPRKRLLPSQLVYIKLFTSQFDHTSPFMPRERNRSCVHAPTETGVPRNDGRETGPTDQCRCIFRFPTLTVESSSATASRQPSGDTRTHSTSSAMRSVRVCCRRNRFAPSLPTATCHCSVETGGSMRTKLGAYNWRTSIQSIKKSLNTQRHTAQTPCSPLLIKDRHPIRNRPSNMENTEAYCMNAQKTLMHPMPRLCLIST